jgi:hypothetical protein
VDIGGYAMINETSKPSRRGMLVGLTVGLAGLGAVAAPALTLDLTNGSPSGDWWDRLFFSLKNGGYAEWSELVGTTFLLGGRGTYTELTLVEVKPFDSRYRRPGSLARDRAFVAVFATSDATATGDRIYSANHEKYGAVDMYLSPVYSAGRSRHMEAVFN